MQVTSERKTNTGNSSCLHQERERLESEIRLLKHILVALCIRELTNKGRHYIQKLIKSREHDLRRFENETGQRKNGN